MDGNDSQKWILRRSLPEEDGSGTPGPSSEHSDHRKVPGDYYLTREEVNKWAEDALEEIRMGG